MRPPAEEAVVFSSGVATSWLRFGPGAEGGGKQLLALHMLGLEGRSFAGLAAELPADWTLHAFDQRGHGAAAAAPPRGFEDFVADAREALDRIEAEQVHLLGCSLGGAVGAMAAAEANRARIASLTLVATPEKGRRIFAERATAQKEGSLEPALRRTLERWFAEVPAPTLGDQVRASLRKMSPAGYDACWRAFAEFGGYGALAPFLPRTLCLAFGEDRSTPPSDLDAIARTLRGGGVAVERADIAGAGHAGLLVRPAELAGHLNRFLLNPT